MSLAGEKVVVLGGSSGIGLAVAKAAGAEGADVVIASRSQDNLKAAKEEIGGDVASFEVDMTQPETVAEAFEAIGKLDHLVITAAQLAGGTVQDTPADALRIAFDSRFWGSYHATKAVAPSISQGGSITYFSGVSAWKPFVGEGVAAASACAMESFARTMAIELAPVRVNTVCPGIIDTPLLDDFFGDQREAVVAGLAEQLPVKRIGQPEDVASAVLFLMGNRYTTGMTLHVDGGHRFI